RNLGRGHHPPRRRVRLGAAGGGACSPHRHRLLPYRVRSRRHRRRRAQPTHGRRPWPGLCPDEEARRAAHERAGRLRRRLSSILLLAAVAAFVGLLIGTVGVGGVLMVSFLALFGGLTIHEAAATSLFSFLFTGIVGTWLYQRRGSIDWSITLPVCAAAAFFGFCGAAAAALVDPRPLAIVIALQIVAATSGSVSHLQHGFIDWNTAAVITVFELLGLVVGVRLAHVASPLVMRRLAGILCILTGGLLLLRTL